jgi:hypothetical protein
MTGNSLLAPPHCTCIAWRSNHHSQLLSAQSACGALSVFRLLLACLVPTS